MKKSKKLIIVESPSKAKTISKFLGGEARVIASKGHIRDLPKYRLGISVEDGKFLPDYETPKSHKELVATLKSEAKGAQILLATDEDREGEAIAYHLACVLGGDVSDYERIVFHEITKDAITNALKHPRKIDMNSVNAQQARRMLDRLVGFKLSNLVSSKVASGLSAGRVQSAALRLIVLREREIRAFKSEEYYEIPAVFKADLDATLSEFNGKKMTGKLTDKALAERIYEHVKTAAWTVGEITYKERKDSPKPPFMTSSLQQAASSKLGFSPKKTMQIAQTLYEGVQTHKGFMGAITYMRTDSLNLSKEAIAAARAQIDADFGAQYLAPKPRQFATKAKGAQEAHEAIRVTDTTFTPAIAKGYLKSDEFKLYKLIYERFLMTQMADSRVQNQTIAINSSAASYRLSGRKVLFDGFLRLNDDASKDKLLPDLKPGERICLQKAELKVLHTEPPARFNEASLIKQLEELGIGRPSTYAPTTSLLVDRKYVTLEKKQLIPSEKGEKLIVFLEEHFAEIVDAEFTSKMELQLDEVATGAHDYNEVLGGFYEPFMSKINSGRENIKSQKVIIELDENCPECGEKLLQRDGRYGAFVSCSSYPKCKYSRSLRNSGSSGEGTGVAESGDGDARTYLRQPCPQCGSAMVQRFSRRGPFFGCTNYPKCKFLTNYPLAERKCAECGSAMVIKQLKRGNFIECAQCKSKEEILGELPVLTTVTKPEFSVTKSNKSRAKK